MKTKMLLLASVFTLGFASCSNDDVVEDKSIFVEGDIKLKVDIAAIDTRAADSAANAGDKSSVQTVDIYLLSPSAVHSSYTISGADIEALTSGSGYVLQKVNGNVENVAIVANKNHSGERVPNGTLVTDLKKLALATDLINIQPKNEDNKRGVANAQMYGMTTSIADSGVKNPATGNSIFTANVTLTPAIARVQVYGAVKHSAAVTNLKVTKIFLDNLYLNGGKEDKFQVETNVDPILSDLLNGVGIFDMNAAGLPTFASKGDGVYAYHIFPQKAAPASKPKNMNVKFIVELNYDQLVDPTGTTENKTEYATLRLATAQGNVLDADAINVDEAKIYTINLGKIDWTGDGNYVEPGPGVEDGDEFEPGDGGETPNQDQKDLKVVVEIQAWEEVEIIPQN